MNYVAPKSERGSTIAILAASMVFMVAMAAIAIDVVVLYVVRSEAQRAADAAALAGAHQFVISGFTSGLLTQSQVCDGSGTGLAEQAAISVASQNNVGGQPGVVKPGDIQCDFSKTVSMGIPPAPPVDVPVNPRITVKVTRENLPTFFSKIWGNAIANTVSASATAEAFNESGSPQPTVSSCLKPFLILNKDVNSGNPFVDVTKNGAITQPGYQTKGGFIGEGLTLLPGDPNNPLGAQQGQYYQLDFPSQPSRCACTGSKYEENIACCNPDALQCGVSTYQVHNSIPDTSDTVNGTQCLINAQAGADTIQLNDPPPFQFLAGAGNPAHVAQGTPIATSNSLITVPLFNGAGLPVPTSVQAIGFLQLFIQSVDVGTGRIQAVIVNVVGCAPGGGGNAFISGGGISPIPVRLVQPGNGGN